MAVMTSPARAIVFDRPPTSPAALARMAVGATALLSLSLALGFAVEGISPITAEERALATVASWRSPAVTTFFAVVTTLGDLWAVALTAAVASPLLYRRAHGWAAVWLLWASLLGALAVTGAIKVVVGRARPLDALVAADSGAFPSGHASRAAAVLGLVAIAVVVLARHRAVRATAVGLCATGIGLMAFSRVYLGVHWPSDVVSGVVVGFAWLAVLLMAVRPRIAPADQVQSGGATVTGPG